jgi:hypothetical protein
MITTAEKLNLKPGDVVRYHNIPVKGSYRDYVVEEGCECAISKATLDRVRLDYPWEVHHPLYLPEKISEDLTPFGELPLEARMDMLRAWQEGKEIEIFVGCGTWVTLYSPCWGKTGIYRVKPKPVKELRFLRDCLVQISYALVNGKPDPSSVKLEVVD